MCQKWGFFRQKISADDSMLTYMLILGLAFQDETGKSVGEDEKNDEVPANCRSPDAHQDEADPGKYARGVACPEFHHQIEDRRPRQ